MSTVLLIVRLLFPSIPHHIAVTPMCSGCECGEAHVANDQLKVHVVLYNNVTDVNGCKLLNQ